MIKVIRIDKIIEELSIELAYLQHCADYWYYIVKDNDMSNFVLNYVTELREICNRFDILDTVYDRALSIYDFSHSGEKYFKLDIQYIEDMQIYFEARHHSRLF